MKRLRQVGFWVWWFLQGLATAGRALLNGLGMASDWFYRRCGIDETLLNDDGYFLFRADLSRKDRVAIIAMAVVSFFSFGFSLFAGTDLLKFWFWLAFGLVAACSIPILFFVDYFRQPICLVEICEGRMRWISQKSESGSGKGKLELRELKGIDLVTDSEGCAERLDLRLNDGLIAHLPSVVTRLILEECRSDFTTAMRFYQPTLYEGLRDVSSARLPNAV